VYPKIDLTPYRGVEHTVEQMLKAVHSPRGAFSPMVRLAAEEVTRYVTPKDYLSEILAIRHWVNAHIYYTFDPVHVEWIRDPQTILEEIKRHGVVKADCDEYTCVMTSMWLSLGHKAEFVTIALRPKPAPFSHVFARCLVPRTNGKLFVVTDPVAGTNETQMLRRAAQWKTIRLD